MREDKSKSEQKNGRTIKVSAYSSDNHQTITKKLLVPQRPVLKTINFKKF